MCTQPLLTTVVGSYPQPDWLVDKSKLRGRLPPRVRAREIWKVSDVELEEAQDDATRLAQFCRILRSGGPLEALLATLLE